MTSVDWTSVVSQWLAATVGGIFGDWKGNDAVDDRLPDGAVVHVIGPNGHTLRVMSNETSLQVDRPTVVSDDRWPLTHDPDGAQVQVQFLELGTVGALEALEDRAARAYASGVRDVGLRDAREDVAHQIALVRERAVHLALA